MHFPAQLIAGMPNIELSDIAKLRWDSISFFLLIFLLCVAGVRWLWNRLTLDFTRLPRISYLTALSATFLWSLLFLLVLTMISGARELLTPGAWKKTGIVYTLDEPHSRRESDSLLKGRQWHLEVLRSLLWTYAASHDGHFPDSIESSGIASELWKQPGTAEVRYGYHGGLKMGDAPSPLVFEYQIYDGAPPLVLSTDGIIKPVTTASNDSDSTLVPEGGV
ncbi:hypothetical protein SH661x_003444 [Planctomicrobium sp. SH661]|uniref:hypothetical protein n=1 Tax=Planctomicrobium sp. SH661 TaxID=3448124 RepID=UPI003F5B4DF5